MWTIFHLFTVVIFFSSIHVGSINGGWRGGVLCGAFGFFMAAIYAIFNYLDARCLYEIKQRDPKPAEKLAKFLFAISFPVFIVMLIATIFASIKLCETLL